MRISIKYVNKYVNKYIFFIRYNFLNKKRNKKMKAIKIIMLLLITLFMTGCTGNNPSLDASGNRYEILTISRLINVTTVYNTNSTITNEKETGL